MIHSRPILSANLQLTSVSFGCSAIGNLYQEITDSSANKVLERAWEHGIRYFDTAPHYGRGLAEVRLGRFLKSKARFSFVVSTKVGRVLRPGSARDEADGFINPLPYERHYDYSAAGFEESLAGSRERLGIDKIDLVYIHDIGERTHGADNGRHLRDLMDTGLPYLAKLKSEGKICGFGLGVNENEICVDILREHSLDVILLAGRWTLLDRSAEDRLVTLCQERGTSLVLGGVFNSGILATGPVEGAHFDYKPASPEILAKVGELAKASEKFDLPLAAASLQFAYSRGGVASVLVGTANPNSLSRNIAALKTPIDEKTLSFISSAMKR
ncbi:aldo/keto reductase [Roseibium sp. SCP14]|uniref:aldo/keto reductase n=1 Tax=Roseibium sp. SCP14 TaxID=3141375 RepID=UPI003337D593